MSGWLQSLPNGAEAVVVMGFLSILFVATAIALLGWALNVGSRRGSIDSLPDESATPEADDHQSLL